MTRLKGIVISCLLVVVPHVGVDKVEAYEDQPLTPPETVEAVPDIPVIDVLMVDAPVVPVVEPEPAPEPEPEPPQEEEPPPPPPRLSWPSPTLLYALRMCESTNNYQINNGNGFRGAYQFVQATWNSVVQRMGRDDLYGVPVNQVAPADQDAVTVWWWNHGSPHDEWPVCSYRAERAA